MASKNPPRISYDSALRSTVERAFDATWTVLQARDPFRDFEQDYEDFAESQAHGARCGWRDRSH
jgi:hypothetical protein